MVLDPFTASDICKIIKECSKSGVSELTFGDAFTVRFGHKANLNQTNVPEQANQEKQGEFFPSVPNSRDKEIADLAEIQETTDSVNEIVQTLAISDPLEFEDQMALGAFEDAEEEAS